MPFFYDESVLPFVQDAIKAAGGEIAHNDLVAKLEAAGRGNAAQSLLPFAQGGMLVSKVKAQPNGAPRLFYSLPS